MPTSIEERKIMSDIISLEDLLSSSGKYKDRMNSTECTEEVKENARQLLSKLNPLLIELGLQKCIVSSGFRTSDANKAANGAKKSLHMIGSAIDIQDKDESLDKRLNTPEGDLLLKKYGLWQEIPTKTIGWVHLDNKDRGTRSKNQFIP